MNRRGIPYRQGVLDAMTLLRGQWTVAVIATLALGEMQFKELHSAINRFEERAEWRYHDRPLSQRVLTDTLQRMQGDNLVDRRAESRYFRAVWYDLTPKGRSLLRAMRPLAQWAQHWSAEHHG